MHLAVRAARGEDRPGQVAQAHAGPAVARDAPDHARLEHEVFQQVRIRQGLPGLVGQVQLVHERKAHTAQQRLAARRYALPSRRCTTAIAVFASAAGAAYPAHHGLKHGLLAAGGRELIVLEQRGKHFLRYARETFG